MRLIKRLVVLLCFLLLLAPTEVPAEDTLEISINYGIDGKVQLGKGYPATVTVKNNGDTISGDLVFFTSPNYETVGNIVIPVEFPKGEETTLQVSIPGLHDNFYYGNQNTKQQMVKFYEDGWENGKEVPLKGSTTKQPVFFQENRVVIGVLTDSPDELNVLKKARFNSDSVEMLNLTKDNFPIDATALEIFDVILINNFQVSKLSEHQTVAIQDWVHSGGHIMIGSDPLLEQHEALQDFFLMEIENQTSFESLNFFSTSKDEELPSFSNVEINTGKLKNNVNVIFSDHNLPMIMNKSFGLGEVTQFAFNVSSETLTNWEEYDHFWSELLQKTVDKNYNGTYMTDELPYRLSSMVEMYPSSFIPVSMLVILYVVYLVLLIPGLYFLLKKLDKREISWIIIPAVAIVSSIAIFVVGAKDRIGGSQINQINVLSIDEEGTANGYGAFSILSNNAGDYPVTIQSKGFQPYPMQNYDYYSPGDTVNSLAMIENGRQQSKITFTEVEYWSIRSAMGDIHSLETGKLLADLRIEDNKLVGTVESELAFDIADAYLLSGSNSYPLGKITAGETSEIEIELDTNNIQNLIGAPRPTIASKVIPGYASSGGYGYSSGPQDSNDLNDWKKYNTLDTAMHYNIQPKNLNKPLIAGYVTEPIIELESDKKIKSHQSLSVITQMVDVEIVSLSGGEFKFNQGTIIPEISIDTANSATGNIYYNGLDYGEGSVDVEQGSYLLSYQIPLQLSLDSIKINQFRLSHPETHETTFSIYNVKEDEFMVLEGGQTTFEDHPEHYISSDGRIIVRLEKSGMNDPVVQIPTLNLEGEYKQ